MKFNSLKFEISTLYSAILGLILILFSGVLYLISNVFLQQGDNQLKAEARLVDASIASYMEGKSPSPGAFLQAVIETTQNKKFSKDYINVVDEGQREIFNSANLDQYLRLLFLENVQFQTMGQTTFRTLGLGQKNIRMIDHPFADRRAGKYLIQVGVAQDPLTQQWRNWLYSIAISVPLILLLTNFVGRVLADKILQPVYEITDLAKRITEQDLSARIKTKHFDPEMVCLIGSFNEMIARLEKSFKHIEQFSYHVAHELKTPLTIIQGEADLLLRRDRASHEYKQALRIVMEESQRVLKTIDDLLLLTKLGYQQEVFRFEQFDFMEFFYEIVEQNRLLAANKGIGIRTDFRPITPPLMIQGDRLHLRRLFFNIIDNAIKFTPAGGCVEMRIEKDKNSIVSFISDTGPGISREKLEKIFDKFYGSDNPDSGLGLSIAYTIAKFHRGDIRVESRLRAGTTFRVVLPLEPVNP